MAKSFCIFIFGPDTFQSHRAMKAIERRFLAQSDSLTDLTRLDMEETSLDVLKQSLLAIPFLVSHRLFILKNCFSAPKATQQGLVDLLEHATNSTVVVIYEPKAPDKRLSLYQWLMKQAKIQEFPQPSGLKLTTLIQSMAKEAGVTIAPAAVQLLATHQANDTWRLNLEIQKLACAALAGNRTMITAGEVTEFACFEDEASLFHLTDSLRDGRLKESIQLYRQLIVQEDPMLLAATLGSQIRTLAKIKLCLKQGITGGNAIARASALNPYVVKLSLASAETLSSHAIKQSYAELIRFDTQVKNGLVTGELGLLLLLFRLHGTLNKTSRGR
jgi:DNA polymerase-3 subunit delta